MTKLRGYRLRLEWSHPLLHSHWKTPLPPPGECCWWNEPIVWPRGFWAWRWEQLLVILLVFNFLCRDMWKPTGSPRLCLPPQRTPRGRRVQCPLLPRRRWTRWDRRDGIIGYVRPSPAYFPQRSRFHWGRRAPRSLLSRRQKKQVAKVETRSEKWGVDPPPSHPLLFRPPRAWRPDGRS